MSEALAERLDGQLLLPSDAGYDAARTVWNAMIDRRPQAIVRCASTSDVAAALKYARERDLEVGVRCGGHSVAGHAVPDGGLMIDLTPMGSVRVDPVQRRAWVQGGAMLGELDRASQEHGLATTAGNVSHTGVGGLTLGGGMGWLARQHGLACDNVASFEMVTADGELVRASATENPDLFWGLRGGGGNFGIVTEFEFRLHDTGTRALVADWFFPLEDALPVMQGWRDLSNEGPRRATYTAWLGTAGANLPEEMRGRPVAAFGLVWIGDPADAAEQLDALEGLGRPVAKEVEELSYVALQRVADTVEGHDLRRYWKGHYFTDLSDDAIEAYLLRGTADGHGDHLPNVGLQSYGGAIADVPDEDSAFSHRQTRFEFVGAGGWEDPAEDEPRIVALRTCAGALDPYASGVYVNALTDEGSAGVRRAFPPAKLARLTALKDRYDPDNVFHLNQNIAPSR